MTRYDDFWVRMPQRFERALQKCGTDAFLVKAGGIVDEFHKGVRGYDGSSEEQFRHPVDAGDGVAAARAVRLDETDRPGIPGPRGVLPAPPRLPEGQGAVGRGGRGRGRGAGMHPAAEARSGPLTNAD